MKTQSHGKQARTEAYLVVDPIRRTAVVVQPWYMRAYPYTEIRKRINASCQRIWFVMIDRGCPVNGQPAQDDAQKDWHVQPMAPPHQQVVPANYTHAGLSLRHACSDHLRDMSGM